MPAVPIETAVKERSVTGVTAAVNVTEPPAQNVVGPPAVIVGVAGVGLTVKVNEVGVPSQPPPKVGVTVTVADAIALLVLRAVKDAILPVPEAARPIEVLLFVQL